ncbi:ABC transporter related [Rippkaea orientalis PCC 8801]|uniref:ABC transporter related n=1 Tax=Rippkaea orientalis (strain PCC 8801 / RF-1) TaxID=41431 RepID=B7K5T1_RIPO1|nr:ATP-binding cassette domain-containing protein [Rippkaea orientalis]ACK67984.1 ABC transporter related [Rippkaea orientalis PCC 8801]
MIKDSNPLLRLSDVCLHDKLGQHQLLTGISFEVNRGDRLGIIGPSGAGKTTLLRLINRLQDPTSGVIEWDSQPLNKIPIIQLRQHIVLIPQEPKLLGMTVEETLGYPLILQQLPKAEIKQRIETWKTHFSIPDEWLSRHELQLSLGQRQLVSIARGLIMQPQLLLLDEPTSALDPDRAHHLMDRLINLSQTTQTTIMMINHQHPLINTFAQRILTLRQGQVQSIVDNQLLS